MNELEPVVWLIVFLISITAHEAAHAWAAWMGGDPTAYLGGQVSLTFSTSIDNLQFVKTGRLRGLAVTGKERLAVAQELPTMAEAGLPGFESLNWNGVVGPAGIPRDTVNRLHREIVRAINLPDVKEKVAAQGNFVIADTPEQFAAFIRAESEKWARVVKQANIRID